MHNLIKADLLKLKKNITFKIEIAVLLIAPLWILIEGILFKTGVIHNALFDQGGAKIIVLMGWSLLTIVIPVLFLFLMPTVISNEYITGFIKITIAQGYPRAKILFSKFIIFLLQLAVFVMIIPILCTIISFILYGWGDIFLWGDIATILGTSVIGILNCTTILSIMFFIAIILKEKVQAMSFIMFLFIFILLFSGMIKNEIFHNIYSYTFGQSMFILNIDLSIGTFFALFIIDIAILLLFGFLSYLIFQKQSIY